MLVVLENRADELADATLAATWFSAIATGVGAIAAALALWFAYRQIRLTSVQMRESAHNQAQDSEERTRPYIAIDFVPSIAGPPWFDLVVSNHGRAIASNLTLDLAGCGFGPLSKNDKIGPALGQMFSSGLDLAPGARRRVLWRIPDQENAEPRGEFGAPEAGKVVVSYGWHPGYGRDERRYIEESEYDLSVYPKVAPQPASGAVADELLADANARNAVNALRAIAENIGELRR